MDLNFLASVSLFQSLTLDEVKVLSLFLETASLPVGHCLFNPGDLRDRLRIVKSGRLQVETSVLDWDETTTVFGPGQFLNESSLLQDGNSHTSRGSALADLQLYLLTRKKFEDLSKQHPSIAGKIQLAIGSYIFQRIHSNPQAHMATVYSSGRKRSEHDLLGERELPVEAYYGVQTLRARENFNITGVTLRNLPALIKGFAIVKKAAAKANTKLGLLPENICNFICQACEEIEQGHWHEQFVVDVLQGGAGTSTNMNANEVIANRALELAGKEKGEYDFLHPNNHVNLSQSTNDAYPTAVRVATLLSIPQLIEAMTELCSELGNKAREFQDVIKMGRTQLQDAVPMTLGQEFEAFRITVEEDISRLKEASKLFFEVNLGGTAIGTGLNAHPDYTAKVIKELRNISGLPFVPSANLIEATPDTGVFILFSGILKRIAVKLSKICNDLRLLSSGPRCGFGEINLPPMQPGSSIMPGKVNPVIPEVVNQIAFQVIGNDLTITMAAEAGQLQLNVMEPVIVFNLFQSLSILTRGMRTLQKLCIKGITANKEVCRRYVENSIGLVTALNPHIGYENSTKIALEALQTGESVFNLVLMHGLMSKEELEDVLRPENMLASRTHLNVSK